MRAEQVDQKNEILRELNEVKEQAKALISELSRASGASLEMIAKDDRLARLDHASRAFQKNTEALKESVVETRRQHGANGGSEELEKALLDVVQNLDEHAKAVRKAENTMLAQVKDLFSLIQEIGERQMNYAHQLWDAIENGWSELSRKPSKEGAFQLKVQISKAVSKYEDVECLWYQIVDKRLMFLKQFKKTSYFPQLFQEATFLNDLAMRSTEFCEKFRNSLGQLKLLPSMCEEFFLIQAELKQIESASAQGNGRDREALKHDLYWMEKSVRDCMLHLSPENAFHQECERALKIIQKLAS